MREISKYPNLHSIEPLFKAIENNTVVFFLGAGVSQYVGCKSWTILADNLIEKCYTLGLINYHESKILKSNQNPKKKISIAYGILKDKNEDSFFEVFNDALKWKTEPGIKCIYDYLAVICKTFVTTNADDCIDTHFLESDIIYDFSKPEKVMPNKVFHVHGHKDHKESLVFTVEQYLKRYNNDNYLSFLDELFKNYTVLFIGYGLEEFELLDYLTLKAKGNNSDKKHYALMPYYSFDKKIAEYDQIYFDSLNIQIIPYAMDDKGYDQLIDIMKDWGNTTTFINQIDTELTMLFSQNTFTGQDIKRILEIIKLDTSFFFCFLKLCTKKPAMTPYLMKPLYDNGFFKQGNDDSSWYILDFLFAFVRCYKSENTREAQNYFIKILDEYTEIDPNKPKDSRINKAILELIFTLNEEEISEKYLSFLETLFDKRNDTFDISYTLTKTIIPYSLSFSNKEKIKRILRVAFCYIDKQYYVESVVYPSFLKDFIKKDIEKVYEILGKEFLDLIIEKISAIKSEYIEFITPWNYKSDTPVVDDSYFNITLFNILLWLIKKQDYQNTIINELKSNNNLTLKECGIKLEETLKDEEVQHNDSSEYDTYELAIESESVPEDVTNWTIDEILQKINEVGINTSFAHKVELWIISHFEKDCLNKFVDVDLVYLDSITSGIESLVRNDVKDEKIEEKLSFILDYYESILSNIYNEQNKDRKKEIEWVHKNICNFITNYIQNFIYSLHIQDYERLKNIIFTIYEHLNFKPFEDTTAFGYMTNLLNHENGTCYKALFYLQAYSFEVQKKQDLDIKEIFNNEIKKKSSAEFFTLIGQCFHYLFGYDKDWSCSIFKELNQKEMPILYKAFCSGYFYTPYQISKNCYTFLEEQKFYEELLKAQFEDSEYYSRLVSIAYIAYLTDKENSIKTDFLIYKIIHSGNIHFINSVIELFSSQTNEIYFEKIFNVWNECILAITPYKDDVDYNETIVKLLRFINTIPKMNESIYNTILFSVIKIPYYQVDQDVIPKFFELHKDAANNNYIDKIILEFSKKETFFSDYDGKFSELFLLIKKSNPEIAQQIANIYYRNNESKYLELLNKPDDSN